MSEPIPCKGFWNICRCPACLARDRRLESELDNAKPDERQKLLAASIKEFHAARGANGKA